MMGMTVTWLAVVVGVLPQGDVRVDCGPTGVLHVKVDGRTVLTGRLTCNGPQWRETRQEQARDVARPKPGTLRGAFAMPHGNKGNLAFEQHVRHTNDRAEVDYTVTFDQDNEIKLQAITLILPTDAFGGRRVTCYPAEARDTWPRGPSTFRSEHFGWAVGLQLDDDRVLLMERRPDEG